jgi:hypothetical protein
MAEDLIIGMKVLRRRLESPPQHSLRIDVVV